MSQKNPHGVKFGDKIRVKKSQIINKHIKKFKKNLQN